MSNLPQRNPGRSGTSNIFSEHDLCTRRSVRICGKICTRRSVTKCSHSLLKNDFFTNRPIASRMDWEAETREEWINDSIEGKQLDTMLHWTKELQVARHHSGSLQATRNVDSHISKTDYSSASRTLLSAVCSSITFESCFTFHILILMKLFNLSKGSDWIYSSRDL